MQIKLLTKSMQKLKVPVEMKCCFGFGNLSISNLVSTFPFRKEVMERSVPAAISE